MSARFAELVQAIERAQLLERDIPRIAAEHWNTPWMPYDLFDFAALLLEASPAIPQPDPETPPLLLGVGAGPGSKELLARDGFGMNVHGIEIIDELAAIGRGHGLDIETADAVTWKGYGDCDCVWLNRPIRDAGAEAALEQRIWDEMTPGAVIICANLEAPPPAGWYIINDSWASLQRGAWAKAGMG